MSKKFRHLFFLAILLNLLNALPAKAEDVFNPSNIISDAEMLDYDAMSLDEIQSFLVSKNSYLAKYSTTNSYGTTKTAAQIIYEAANNNYDCDDVDLSDTPNEKERQEKCQPLKTINPKVLLVMLQKEQGLTEKSNPEQSRLDWAMGYGCPDGGGCSQYWKGFGKQVNSTALQFLDYMKRPKLYKYQAGQTYTFTNPYSTIKNETNVVTPVNQATASLYNYTPHVYNGNYNFYRFWKKYFTKSYPDGTLVKANEEAGVWLLQDKKRRPFLTKTALTSRFDEKKIVTISKSDLEKYEKGAPIKFPNYSIVRSPKGNIYLLTGNKKRGFADGQAFKKIGYNPEEIMNASWEDINSYAESSPITSTSTYPLGALLQDKKTGGIYWVSDGEKAPIWDRVVLKINFKNNRIIKVSAEELNTYKTTSPVLLGDGELLRSPNSVDVYLVSEGKKRSFSSEKVFDSMGYKKENIITIPAKMLYLYPNGEPINDFGEEKTEVANDIKK